MVELELIFMVCRLLPVWKNSRLNANIKKIDVKEMVSHYFPLISACMTVLQRHCISQMLQVKIKIMKSRC